MEGNLFTCPVSENGTCSVENGACDDSGSACWCLSDDGWGVSEVLSRANGVLTCSRDIHAQVLIHGLCAAFTLSGVFLRLIVLFRRLFFEKKSLPVERVLVEFLLSVLFLACLLFALLEPQQDLFETRNVASVSNAIIIWLVRMFMNLTLSKSVRFALSTASQAFKNANLAQGKSVERMLQGAFVFDFIITLVPLVSVLLDKGSYVLLVCITLLLDELTAGVMLLFAVKRTLEAYDRGLQFMESSCSSSKMIKIARNRKRMAIVLRWKLTAFVLDVCLAALCFLSAPVRFFIVSYLWALPNCTFEANFFQLALQRLRGSNTRISSSIRPSSLHVSTVRPSSTVIPASQAQLD